MPHDGTGEVERGQFTGNLASVLTRFDFDLQVIGNLWRDDKLAMDFHEELWGLNQGKESRRVAQEDKFKKYLGLESSGHDKRVCVVGR